MLYVDELGRARTLTHVRRRGRGNRTLVGRIAESEVRGERGMAFIAPAQPSTRTPPNVFDLLRGRA